MGYPEDFLAPEEKLLLHRHQHWKALLMPGFWAIVLTALAGGLSAWIASVDVTGTLATIWPYLVWGVWLLLFSWLCIAPFIRWATTHFVITDRRIMYRTGVFTRTGIDIPVARINSVQFRHGLIDRMLKTGTLIVESASDDPLEFDDIPQVEAVHSMLYNELYDELHEDPTP
jgi:uncharacterized membrane protein YdbT with pleckstrin-like domain